MAQALLERVVLVVVVFVVPRLLETREELPLHPRVVQRVLRRLPCPLRLPLVVVGRPFYAMVRPHQRPFQLVEPQRRAARVQFRVVPPFPLLPFPRPRARFLRQHIRLRVGLPFPVVAEKPQVPRQQGQEQPVQGGGLLLVAAVAVLLLVVPRVVD